MKYVVTFALVVLTQAMMASVGSAATYFVDRKHPDASDANGGTAKQPLATISAAVAKLKPGDTVTVKAGVYREGVEIKASGTADKPIVIAAAKGEVVVVSGADLVSGWVRVEGKKPIWKKTPWKWWKRYNAKAGRGPGPQLFVDNVPYRPVETQKEMFPGSYCWNPADDGALYLWIYPPRAGDVKVAEGAEWWDNPVNLASDDPNDHQVEASVRYGNIWGRNISHVVIRGFVVRYNTARAQAGGLSIDSDVKKGIVSRNCIIEDCVVEYCRGKGIGISGENMIVRRCYMRRNGALGASGLLVNSVFEDCVLDGNGTLGYSHGWEAGGVKFVRSTGLTVRRCQFINNDGPGLWFDWGNSGIIAEQNFCSFNSGSGIMMEVSPLFDRPGDAGAKGIVDIVGPGFPNVPKDTPAAPNIVRNNVCVGNRWDGTWWSGILLQLASNTIVANNTVVGNGQYGIFVRYHPYEPKKYTHRCVDNVIINNICADNTGSQIYITPDPADKPGRVARNRSDYNILWYTKAWLNKNESTQKKDYGWNRSAFSRWGKTMGNFTYSVEEWFKIRGFDEHSVQWEPGFVSASLLDYRLHRDSVAIGAGERTKYVTDDYLGRKRPEGRPPSIGALEYFPTTPAATKMPMR